MRKSSSYKRHRNPPSKDEQAQEKPFFSKGADKDNSSTFFTANTKPVQAKLTVGQPGDQYEKEADSVADKVVNKSAETPQIQQQQISTIQRSTLMSPVEDEKLGTAEARMEKDKMIQEKPIQKMDEEEETPVAQAKEEEESITTQAKEEDEPIQEKEMEEDMQKKEEEELQAKSKVAAAPSKGLGTQLKSAKGRGKPLHAKTKHEMESAIGANFDGVNIHTDTQSVEMNQALKAQAFTNGKDIYFNTGKYRPETAEGKRLLAHELTHVVQQGGETIRRKEKVGEKFQHNPGITSPYKVISGHFDGRELILMGDGKEFYRKKAQSGRPYTVAASDAKKCNGNDTDSYMNNPLYVGIRNNGPIPEGRYRFKAEQAAIFGYMDRTKLNLGKNKTFKDPFGRNMHGGDWGTGRVALHPVKIKAGPKGCGNTKQRSGFYLHGGILPGSSGCIDVGNRGYKKVLKHLQGYKNNIEIEVKYSHEAQKVGRFRRFLGRIAYGRPGE